MKRRLPLAILLATIFATNTAAAVHPLAPLTTNEIAAAVQILVRENRVGTNMTLPTMTLREPSKSAVLAWRPGSILPREVFVVAYDLARHRTHEGVVNLSQRRTTQWRELSGVEPPYTLSYFGLSSRLLQTNELWLAALRRRGITDPATVDGSGLPTGIIRPAGAEGGMLLRNTPFMRANKHLTWEPLSGLEVIFDLSRGKVLDVIDAEVFPRTSRSLDFYDPAVRGRREALKPLVVTQPEGPSFKVTDHEVSWDRWRFR